MLLQNPRKALKDQQWEEREISQGEKNDLKTKKGKNVQSLKVLCFLE